MNNTQVNSTRAAVLAQGWPVTSFLVLALVTSTAMLTLLTMAQRGVIPGASLLRQTGWEMGELASVLLILTLFPSALLITTLEGGRPSARRLFRRMTRWRVGPGWWLVAVVALPGGTVLLAVLFGDVARVPSPTILGAETVAITIALLGINVWEEATWAGFLQTRLEQRHGFLLASALTAVPFAAVHMPLRVVTGEVGTAGDLVVSFVGLLPFLVFLRVLLGVVMRGARNSILLVATTHTFFNRSNNVDGIAADVLVGDQRQNAALLVTVVLALVLVAVHRRALTQRYRTELDRGEEEGLRYA